MIFQELGIWVFNWVTQILIPKVILTIGYFLNMNDETVVGIIETHICSNIYKWMGMISWSEHLPFI